MNVPMYRNSFEKTFVTPEGIRTFTFYKIFALTQVSYHVITLDKPDEPITFRMRRHENVWSIKSEMPLPGWVEALEPAFRNAIQGQ